MMLDGRREMRDGRRETRDEIPETREVCLKTLVSRLSSPHYFLAFAFDLTTFFG